MTKIYAIRTRFSIHITTARFHMLGVFFPLTSMCVVTKPMYTSHAKYRKDVVTATHLKAFLSELDATVYLNGEGRAPKVAERGINSKNKTRVPHISIPF